MSKRSGPEWTLAMDTVCARNSDVNRTQLRAELTTIYIETQQRGWAELTELLAAESVHPSSENIPALYDLSNEVYQRLIDAVKRLVHLHMVPSVEAHYSATHRLELIEDDVGVLRKNLDSDTALELYMLIRTMLKSSGSQWYLYASHTSTPRSRQEDTCVEEILSVIAWLPFLRRIRRHPLISELCQRILLACSPEVAGYVMMYSASWDGFSYLPSDDFRTISEAEARQQGEERKERTQFQSFITSLDRLLDAPTLRIPPGGLLLEEITGARAQLVKVLDYFLVCSQNLTQMSRRSILHLPVDVRFCVTPIPMS